MIVTIYQNRHYSGLIPFPRGIHTDLRFIEMRVRFLPSCRYDIGKEQTKINKAFGIGWPIPHVESARFGWRWNPGRDAIEVFAYPYVRCENMYLKAVLSRGSDFADEQYKLGEVGIDEESVMSVFAPAGRQIYTLNDNVTYIEAGSDRRGPGFILGTYFGGTCPAPHKMQIEMERIRYLSK